LHLKPSFLLLFFPPIFLFIPSLLLPSLSLSLSLALIMRTVCMIAALAVTLACFVSAQSVYQSEPREVFERVSSRGIGGWVVGEPTSPDTPVSFTIATSQNMLGVEELRFYVERSSDPRSDLYGKHLSQEQVQRLTADAGASQDVVSWLLSYNIPERKIDANHGTGFIRVTDVPVAIVNKVFETEFYEHRNVEDGRIVHRALNYRLPASISRSIDFVAYVHELPRKNQFRFSNSRLRGAETQGVTPQLLISFYQVDNPTVSNGASNSLFESLGQQFDPQDLQAYQQMFNVPQTPVDQIIGPNNPSACTENPNNCGESMLDVEVRVFMYLYVFLLLLLLR
jgi:subtilase family serine protease